MRRTSIRLTQHLVDSFVFAGSGPKAQDIRWDATIPGFGVRVYPTGRKAYVLSYRVNGRKHIAQIGRCEKLKLKKARSEALAELARIGDGVDLVEERKAEAHAGTMRDLCSMYLQRHASRKKSGRDDERRIERTILPRWGNRKANDLKRQEVAALHHEIGERAPYEANRTLALLRKMFNLSRTWGFLQHGEPNPAQDIAMFRETKRDRWVTHEELPRLAKAIDEEANIYARAALWLYLLLGMRRNELLRLRWTEVDFARGEIRISDTKAGRPHVIPLAPAAAEILQDIPREDGNPYVFCGAKAGSHLVNIDKPWRRARDRATILEWEENPTLAPLIQFIRERKTKELSRQRGQEESAPRRTGNEPTRQQRNAEPTIEEIREAAGSPLPSGLLDARLHDLRRTVGSWLAQNGASLHLIGRVLGHSQVSTTAIYARFAQDQVRAALDHHASQVMAVAQSKPGTKNSDMNK